ncbi:MAG: SUMF1/EgtB/PvdO family nonheme iron enzyme [Candidatus Latescibacteria bacterium]|nr:SUMF1/EgtB/PvdO family nonheme iron enzyme [Candidatus Latescibacterota bacterium]
MKTKMLLSSSLPVLLLWLFSCGTDNVSNTQDDYNNPPEILSLTSESTVVPSETEVEIICIATDPEEDDIIYIWNIIIAFNFADGWTSFEESTKYATIFGSFKHNGNRAQFSAPPVFIDSHEVIGGYVTFECTVTDSFHAADEYYDKKSLTLSYSPVLSGDFSLDGSIIENDSGLIGVKVSLQRINLYQTGITDNNGYYSFTDLPSGTYVIIPVKTDYIFSPDSLTVMITDKDVHVPDFSATKKGSQLTQVITFTPIPAGTFLMGTDTVSSTYEKPAHTVTISAFEMSMNEITNSQYAEFLNSVRQSGLVSVTHNSVVTTVSGSSGDFSGKEYINLSSMPPLNEDNKSHILYSDDTFSVESEKENWPVVYVTWYGAKAFAQYYGYDLPTESEWEYAARSGNQYMYGTANGSLNTGNTNYHDSDYLHPIDVGSYAANSFGIHDMSGNVSEWCNDWWGIYPNENLTDPTGPGTGEMRVYRGGNFGVFADGCRSAARMNNYPHGYSAYCGFRVVLRPGGVIY